jgi:hypothetical protein
LIEHLFEQLIDFSGAPTPGVLWQSAERTSSTSLRGANRSRMAGVRSWGTTARSPFAAPIGARTTERTTNVNAVIDRRRAAEPQRAIPQARGQGKSQGYRGFHPALDERCEIALAEHLAVPTAGPAWARAVDSLALAGRVVAAHGMPARHAAARQQLAGFLGVYDRFFRLTEDWQLSPCPAPGAPLTWRAADGHLVVDVVRTAPPSHPLVDAGTTARMSELAAWSQAQGARVVAFRVLAMSAPAASLLHVPGGGMRPLAGSPLGGHVSSPSGVTR